MAKQRAPTLEDLNRIVADLGRGLQQTKQRMDQVGRQIGELTNGWGKFVELLVMPGVGPALKCRGFRMFGVTGPSKRRIRGETYEVDTLAVGHDPRGEPVVVAAEIRSHLDVASVGEWIEALARFYRFFPEYQDHLLYGMVAGIRVDEGVDRLATAEGLFMLVPSGDTVVLGNPPGFKPRVWRYR